MGSSLDAFMPQEEAEAVTGMVDPAAAGAWVLGRPAAVTAWAAIKLGPGGAVLCARGAAAPIHIDALRVRFDNDLASCVLISTGHSWCAAWDDRCSLLSGAGHDVLASTATSDGMQQNTSEYEWFDSTAGASKGHCWVWGQLCRRDRTGLHAWPQPRGHAGAGQRRWRCDSHRQR